MPAVPKVFQDPDEIPAQLAELGLTVDMVRGAVDNGYRAKAACTANDPLAFPGTAFWARTTSGLREQLRPRGWLPRCEEGYELVVNPEGTMAIVVATGDDATGIATRTPKTNRPKGQKTIEAVETNRGQIDLFASGETAEEHRQRDGDWVTWFLLIKDLRVGDRHFVRAELSLPAEMGDDGRVERWERRIILPEFIDGDERSLAEEPDLGPEFDVEIRRLPSA